MEEKQIEKKRKAVERPKPVIQKGIVQRVVQPVRYVQAHSLIRKHGAMIVNLLHNWWQGTGSVYLGNPAEMVWVSFAQLFADFQLSTGAVGPTFKQLQWFGDDSPFPEGSKPTWGERARWFQLLLKQYWSTNKVPIETKSCPPFSGCIMCWMVCARITWNASRLEWIDQHLQMKLGGALRQGKKIRELDHFQVDGRFVIPTNNGGRGKGLNCEIVRLPDPWHRMI